MGSACGCSELWGISVLTGRGDVGLWWISVGSACDGDGLSCISVCSG